MNKGIMYNGENYWDGTAGMAILNMEKGRNNNMNVKKGDVYRLTNGTKTNEVIVISGEEACRDTMINCIVINDDLKSKYCVPLKQGKGYANTKVIIFARRDSLTEFVRVLSDDEIKDIDNMIVSSFGIEMAQNKIAIEELEKTSALCKEYMDKNDDLKKHIEKLNSENEVLKNNVNTEEVTQLKAKIELMQNMYETLLQTVIKG